ncbi:diguanylate cyclase [Paracoccus sp. (in: a-proteobacteria)]|uniref:diguanylate cyclase n=1 Tax=Paracoccus sp. TaxID=267 RepID=UPI0028A2A3FB|nr:diguanylate cyclase [Paracoccus sp. (in: a-proteobacteria)]
MTERILVVDGVPTNRIVMKVRLSAASHEVAALSSAKEALQYLQSHLPRMILIGASLPDSTTLQLCRDIRALPGCQHMPILLQGAKGQNLAALQAGATTVLDPDEDDLTLFARIRSLLRQCHTNTDIQSPELSLPLASPAPLRHGRPHAVLIADQVGTALSWRYALQDRLSCDISVCDPERALLEAQAGPGADLYVIAADIQRTDDGLRLLSELRSRPHSQHAAFVIALRPERSAAIAMALDLGAGDILPHALGPDTVAAEAALRLKAQLERKFLADRQRREVRRNILWAMTDPLTGLHNRRYAMPRLAELIESCRQQSQPVALLALDLDRFKSVNDHFGHAAGDQALIAVAERLRNALPTEALVARIGGEEFIAAFPLQHRDEALDLAETVRLCVSQTPMKVQAEQGEVDLTVTVSVGVSVLPNSGPHSPPVSAEILLSRADRALLCAKSQGRNRIIMAPQGMAA